MLLKCLTFCFCIFLRSTAASEHFCYINKMHELLFYTHTHTLSLPQPPMDNKNIQEILIEIYENQLSKKSMKQTRFPIQSDINNIIKLKYRNQQIFSKHTRKLRRERTLEWLHRVERGTTFTAN